MHRNRRPSQWFSPIGERSNICQNHSSGLRSLNFCRSTSGKCPASSVTFIRVERQAQHIPRQFAGQRQVQLAPVRPPQVELVELVAHDLARAAPGCWCRVNSSSRNWIQRRYTSSASGAGCGTLACPGCGTSPDSPYRLRTINHARQDAANRPHRNATPIALS